MYEFTSDCLIGIESIDNEHKKLFDIINGIESILRENEISDRCSSENIQVLINELKDYADKHFANEENYMRSINDPELELQIRQHNEFRVKISEMLAEKDLKEAEAYNGILLFLTKWLFRHILSSDVMIGKMQPKKYESGKRVGRAEFSEEYYIGLELIDNEHRTLFEIIAEAQKLIEDEFIPDKYDNIMDIIRKLTEYTRIHFEDEEKYMESIGYEGLEVQKRAHSAFVSRLQEIEKDEIDDNQQEYLTDLMEFLYTWLVQHILKLDKQIPVKQQ